MSRHRIPRHAVVLALGTSWITLIGQTLASSQIAAPRIPGTSESKADIEDATTALSGLDRFLTSINTDKPLYKPGETVFVRGVLLNAFDHRPLPGSANSRANIEVKGPKGNVVAGGYAAIKDSVWGFAWTVPMQSDGGEYKIRATYQGGYTPATRKFDVRVYRAPRLKWQIKFQHDGYGPGEKVVATLDVKRAEGGVPGGAKVSVMATLDGREIKGEPTVVGANGLCKASINLPDKISRGEGTLALVIEDGGVLETASKTIPILLQTVDMQLYPEGGDLIADFNNRVYFQANQPNGKPADISGNVVCKEGNHNAIVGFFRTEHEGRGRFEFTPHAQKQYFLQILKPTGIKTNYALPAVKATGAVIRADKNVYKKNEPITLQVASTEKNCQVTLSKREVEYGSLNIPNVAGKGKFMPVSFPVPGKLDGVLTATVWSKTGTPLAERLIFREPSKHINIKISSAQDSYSPGNLAKLTIKATDDAGRPVSAVVGVNVTDDSVLEMVDKREQTPRLGVMVYLEPEVRDLADAHVYMDAKNPSAPIATDLLLGTQGWRRFAMVHLDKFLQSYRDKALNVVALKLTDQSLNSNSGRNQMVRNGAFMKLKPSGRVGFDVLHGPPMRFNQLLLKDRADVIGNALVKEPALPQDIGRVQGPRDLNLFEVEPTVIDERHYVSGRDERHQKTSPTLPNGSPIPDNDDSGPPVDRFAHFATPTVHNLVALREYAFEVRPNRQPHDRVDFTETLYWNTGVVTNPTTGEAIVRFGLNDSVTTFKAFADGFTGNGAIGSATTVIKSAQPLYAEAKLPLEVTSGDRVDMPITLVNTSGNQLVNPKLTVDLKGDFKLRKLTDATGVLKPNERKRWIEPIEIGFNKEQSDLVLNAEAGNLRDTVTRKLTVKPSGFPISEGFGGMLEPGKGIVHTVTIPIGVVPSSMKSSSVIYVTPLASMNEALQRMIQDPSGCFEQTSSTSYPLTMAQQYFMTHSGVDPKLIETSREKLDDGYKRLLSFWCPDRGYEWFGENPGHEALTAFGLLHFVDMSKVRNVDQNMIATTRAWLLKQKDGQGGFKRNRRALHSWIEDKDCSNAYIVWALLETGQPTADLKQELESLKSAALASKNSYVRALAANAFFLADDKATAKKLMDDLVAKQEPEGKVGGATSSIVGSGGESLEVETTALATLAWLRDPTYTLNVEKSVKYLADSCKDGRYGSTQATVLALRAVIEYDRQRAKPSAPGQVELLVDGQTVGDWVKFDTTTQGSIKLPDASELLPPGKHKLELRMDGGKAMPYSLAINFNTKTPASFPDCKLNISVKLAKEKLVEGNATEAFITVSNVSKEAVPNPVAIVGLPGGLEPRHDQLKELVKKKTIDAYEVRGREVVFYWRALGAGEQQQVPLSLIAAIPGSYTGPASRAYLYYTDEAKKWVDGLHVEIAAK